MSAETFVAFGRDDLTKDELELLIKLEKQDRKIALRIIRIDRGEKVYKKAPDAWGIRYFGKNLFLN